MSSVALTHRHPYYGMMQIFRLNWPFYFAGAAIIAVLAAVVVLMPLNIYLLIVVTTPLVADAYWMTASLVVSHLVYDRSALYRFDWIGRVFHEPPRRWVNIHAGLDETTEPLRALFPGTITNTFDIYEPKAMTESSIERARELHTGERFSEHADFARLPLNFAECDAIFLLLAAHELRAPADRERFFKELQRVTARGGLVVIAEHLRNLWNFAAFGPNVWHFLPRSEWLRLAREAKFTVENEFNLTPFVRVFVLRA